MGKEKGDENRYGNRKGQPVWAERDREWGKGRDGASGAGSGERRENATLVRDVQEY